MSLPSPDGSLNSPTHENVSDGTSVSAISTGTRIKDGKKKRKKIQNTHCFYMELSQYERELFATVTEEISLQNTAGLQNIKRKLWKGKGPLKVIKVIVMFLQLALNCYTVSRIFYLTMYQLGADGGLVLTKSSLEVCDDRLAPLQCSSAESITKGCFKTDLPRMTLMRVICGSEAAIVLSMTIILVMASIHLLMCRDPAPFAKRHYFYIMALPKVGAKFSFLSFLHVANVERLKSFIVRGEFRCLTTLCCNVFRGRQPELNNTNAPDRENDIETFDKAGFENRVSVASSTISGDEERGKPTGLVNRVSTEGRTLCSTPCAFKYEVFGLIMCGLLVMLALHALLVKLMMIYFAAIYSYYTWSYQEWLLFLGFVNQLSGVSLSTEVEMLRILLFKFGGEHARWGSRQIEACGTYFRYFATRSVQQTDRFKALIILWTMNSADLQRLFQGKQRIQEQKAVRHEEMEMFTKLGSCDELVQMRESLLRRFQDTQGNLSQLLGSSSPDFRLEKLHDLQTKAIGQLRLAARVQEHVWEWLKVGLLEEGQPMRKELKLSGIMDGEALAKKVQEAGDVLRKTSDSVEPQDGVFAAESTLHESGVLMTESIGGSSVELHPCSREVSTVDHARIHSALSCHALCSSAASIANHARTSPLPSRNPGPPVESENSNSEIAYLEDVNSEGLSI